MPDVTIQDSFFERSLLPDERAAAASELATRGQDALPILEALFNGEARNEWGVPYLSLGTPVDCGLVAAARLGCVAKPLEGHLRAALQRGHQYAAAALGALGTLDDASVETLAVALGRSGADAVEAAQALLRCNAIEHVAVKEAVGSSPRAVFAIEWARRHAKA